MLRSRSRRRVGMIESGWLSSTLVAVVLLGGAPVAIEAQGLGYGTPDNPGEIDFDRPESWAMKYFTSVSLLTGLGVPGAMESGDIAIALEGGLIPDLSDAQRRVGFNGTKLEDLNKTNLFGRVRVSVSLPGDVEFTVAYVPPVELGGAKPNLFAASVGAPIYRTSGMRVGWRVHGQLGSIEGDFTCDEETVAFGNDPVRNSFGCDAVSNDETSQRYVGLEVGVAAEAGRVEPYLTLGLNRFSTKFETNAITNGTLDDSTFETSGFTVHGAGGAVIHLNERFSLSGEVFYTPLGVDRPGASTIVSETDGLLNARGQIRYYFR